MNELMAIETNRPQTPVSVPDSVIEEYLSSLGNNLSPKHRNQFIQIARAFNLNPFIREIYGIPYSGNFNIIVGYEVYLKRAENSGMLGGWRAWTEGEGASLKGCVEITRKDWTAPFYHEVYFEEYDQKNSMWKSKGRTMIKKVAIAQGFRMAFPVELGGIPYTADELPSVVSDSTPARAPKEPFHRQERHDAPEQVLDPVIVKEMDDAVNLDGLAEVWNTIPTELRHGYAALKDAAKARIAGGV